MPRVMPKMDGSLQNGPGERIRLGALANALCNAMDLSHNRLTRNAMPEVLKMWVAAIPGHRMSGINTDEVDLSVVVFLEPGPVSYVQHCCLSEIGAEELHHLCLARVVQRG